MRPVLKADNPYHHTVPLSNLGTLTSWNPLGHPRLVTELLYLLTSFVYHSLEIWWCGISTSYGPGFESRKRKEVFLFSKIVLSRSGVHRISYLMGNMLFISSGVERTGREVYHSTFYADVKNGWIFTINSPVRFHGVDRYNITFSLHSVFSNK
jgi:hypothetical protein